MEEIKKEALEKTNNLEKQLIKKNKNYWQRKLKNGLKFWQKCWISYNFWQNKIWSCIATGNVATYDPVLREHLLRMRIGQNSPLTYMSPHIQNEFIEILGNRVHQVIIACVQNAKYYSMSFNSVPDTSHKDQRSQVVRYVMIENQEVRAEESFIDFIEMIK